MEKENPQLSQNQEEEKLLEKLRNLIPPGMEAIVLADRGFGRVELFKDVRLNQLIDFGQVLYHKKEKYPVRLIYQFAPGQEEPWFLVTNLGWEAKRIPKAYGHRMEIEEKFKDFKNLRTGLGLKGVVLSTACRYERLLLVVVYAYLFLLLAGAYGEEKGYHRRLVASSTTQRRVLGLWQVGYYTLNAFRVSCRRLLGFLPSLMPEI